MPIGSLLFNRRQSAPSASSAGDKLYVGTDGKFYAVAPDGTQKEIGGGKLAATAWSANHTNTTGHPYLVGTFVYFSGHVFRCRANNDSIIPAVGGNTYWEDLGLGYLIEQDLHEAPIDGNQYARKDGAWESIQTGNPFDQSLNTTDSVEFAGLYVSQTANLDYANIGEISLSNSVNLKGQGGELYLGPNNPVATQYWVSQLGFASSSQIPTSTSQLTNDSGFISGDQGVSTTDSPSFSGLGIAGGAITSDGSTLYLNGIRLVKDGDSNTQLENSAGFTTSDTPVGTFPNNVGYLTAESSSSNPTFASLNLGTWSGGATNWSAPISQEIGAAIEDLTGVISDLNTTLQGKADVGGNISVFTNDSGFISGDQGVSTADDVTFASVSTGTISAEGGVSTISYANIGEICLSNSTVLQGGGGDLYIFNKGKVATVNDLPNVPSYTSQLTNDSGFLTYSGTISYADAANNANLLSGYMSAVKVNINAAGDGEASFANGACTIDASGNIAAHNLGTAASHDYTDFDAAGAASTALNTATARAVAFAIALA